MAKELEKTLLVEDEEYNINAVQADKVSNKLIINKVATDSADSYIEEVLEYIANESFPLEFDGENEKNLYIVPASGGKFLGPVEAPSLICNIKEAEYDFEPTDVLNYSDITNVVVKALSNSSILYSWDPTAEESPKFSPVLEDDQICGIGLVTGKEDYIKAESENSFAVANVNNKWLPGYLYICSDSYNLYYGTFESTSAIRLAINAESADSAKKLADSKTFSVNLGENNSAAFDGTTDVTLGVSGILPIEKGGTGATTVDGAKISLGLATVAFSGNYNDLTDTPNYAGASEAGGTAHRAISDELGTPIRTNYYRSASNSTDVNTISIWPSSNYPNGLSSYTGGYNGDIIILY